MKRFLKWVVMILVFAMVAEYAVEVAMARGGRGRGRGGRGRGGRGRGGRGGGDEGPQTPKEVMKVLMEKRLGQEREDCAAEARDAGAEAGVDGLNAELRRRDRATDAEGRRVDWRARANVGADRR